MICFSLCESLCHRGSGGCAAWALTSTGVRELLSPHTTLQRAWSSHQSEPDSPPAYWDWRKGHKVTVTRLSNYTKNTAQKALGNLCTRGLEK